MTENQLKARKALQTIKDFDTKLKKRIQKLDALRMAALPGAIRYDKDKIQTTPENLIEKILTDAHDLEQEIEEDIASIEGKKRIAYDTIMRLEDETEQTVLLCYYLDGLSYERTAEHIDMSTRNIYRIEDDALEHYGLIM